MSTFPSSLGNSSGLLRLRIVTEERGAGSSLCLWQCFGGHLLFLPAVSMAVSHICHRNTVAYHFMLFIDFNC